MILLFVTTLCYSTSLVAPKSEISYGGNYNLRFLSAHTRRELRAPFFPPMGSAMDSRSPVDAPFSLYPGSPVSFYVRGAGFLWTDDQLWNFTLREFQFPDEDEDKEEEASARTESAARTPRRIVFSDRLGKIAPWVFQRPVRTVEEMNYGDVHTEIRNGEGVFIRDAQSGRFLTVDQGMSSIVDDIDGIKSEEEGEIPRIMVR